MALTFQFIMQIFQFISQLTYDTCNLGICVFHLLIVGLLYSYYEYFSFGLSVVGVSVSFKNIEETEKSV